MPHAINGLQDTLPAPEPGIACNAHRCPSVAKGSFVGRYLSYLSRAGCPAVGVKTRRGTKKGVFRVIPGFSG